jgi:FMN phosphatase YigB (HAD superfamily)
MVRVLMLDLGDTLIRRSDRTVYPHVKQALETIRHFHTASGEPLRVCLVSDYHMPSANRPLDTIVAEFLSLLEFTGLKTFFEPTEQKVTLSSHVGVNKPERRIFEAAVERLGISASLDECIFITENTAHLQVGRDYGMKTIRFGEPGELEPSFSDWSEAPLLVAQLINSSSSANVTEAIKLRLAVSHNLEVQNIEPTGENEFHIYAKAWQPLHEGVGALEGVRVQLPVEGSIEMDDQGHIKAEQITTPSEEALAEARTYVQNLVDSKQIEFSTGTLSPGTTYQVEEEPSGERRLVRKRYSAL